MEITDGKKIELNGLIHKGVDKILILMATLSVVYGVVFSIIEKTYHMQVVAAFLPVVAIVVWILFIFLRIDRLKLENGKLSPRIHFTVDGEEVLFEPYVNRYSRSDTSNKITAIGFFLKENGIPEIKYQRLYRKILLLRLVVVLGIVAPVIFTV